MVSKANFLILDEPTNHLDLLSIDLLIEALNRYQGSLILVSHDRHFISKAANRIWEIEDHEIKDFAGGYEEWMEWKERKKTEAAKQSQVQAKPEKKQQEQKPVEDIKPQPAQKNNAPIDKELKKELQKQQRNLQQLEEKLAALTKQKKTLEDQLTLPEIYSDKNKFLSTEAEYKKITATLEATNREYEAVFEKLVALEERGK
jgi:ATP-binding cassette subfamily F protein 3